ncbi:hypothetical protein [Sphingomonas glaciei]|uniref:UrcA family protein n=1 Tax=Sphingomonas glaciei TaxID=2938948 RepID=A0ABY5MSJ0_9SPHN|nr:hypothetical protein [Sphingomonas glaciei]UUR07377.1 hypothetical protein M1K48_10550 [Sphingomonas glaciei]
MILAAFSLMAAQAVAPASPSSDVVVTARRLQAWRGKANANARGSRCRTTQSTGDKDLDHIACDSMRWCMGTMQGQAAALAERGIAADVRQQRQATLNAGLTTCMTEQHERRVSDLLDRRVAARIEASAKN